MSIFEYLQTCFIEDFAEWLVNFQDQCEENVVEQFIEVGCGVTKVQLAPEILQVRMIEYLNEEIEDDTE